ncbi:uncharacterized protein LOC126835047 isoform X2 [Adelges cooleyi]|nr:uncharacterized protein LOC126835047 isoform X2 [Adelges cooleyi]XP_050423313.1 uncharacterized protein LOC126835047 isoform X2 [Adelges cooleyi]XP_050423314.1 uncharacterized protein LOC126835047 isoform X2 [Adelges cooleyi]
MDKSKNKTSMEFSRNISSSYSIQFGDNTLGNTLDERIQAAKAAAIKGKRSQKQNINDRLHMKNNIHGFNIEKSNKINFSSSNKTHIKSNETLETKKKIRQHSQLTKPNNSELLPISGNLQNKLNVSNSKIAPKASGLMQRRLEAIKSKKLSNIFSSEYDNEISSSTCSPFSNPSMKQIKPLIKNVISIQSGVNNLSIKVLSNKKTCAQKSSSSVTNEHCNRFEEVPAATNSSVQNRLIRARNEVHAKSAHQNATKTKLLNKPNVSQSINKNHSASLADRQNKHKVSPHNDRTKVKRLCTNSQSAINCQTKSNTVVSTVKKIAVSNKPNIKNIINKQLITIKEKSISFSQTKAEQREAVTQMIEKPKESTTRLPQSRINNFSFVVPEQYSAQQRLENIKKGLNPRIGSLSVTTQENHSQLNYVKSDDEMDWEDIETDNIIESVNDLRRTTHKYEPMECTPDTIMHSDKINCCLVIDTNILLSNLKACMAIVDKYFYEFGYMTIVLPWQVLHELDQMKKSEDALGYRAREATRWLLEMLSKNHPQLKGQPMTQKDNMTPDDAILKCALIIKGRVNTVMLVTDDKILSVKSEVSGIPVRNSLWLLEIIKEKNPNDANVFRTAAQMYPDIEKNVFMNFEPRLEYTFARILKRASIKYTIQSNNPKMSTNWWKIFSMSLPINLNQMLIKMKENWHIVAPQQLFYTPKNQLKWLANFFKDTPSSIIEISWNDFYCMLKHCTDVINALPYEYFEITDILLNDLMIARKIFKHKLNTSTASVESVSFNMSKLELSKEKINVEYILNNILLGVDKFCYYVYKVNGLANPSNLLEEKQCKLLPLKSELNTQIDEFYSKVTTIVDIMLKINKLDSETLLDNQDTIVNEFLKSIIGFNKYFAKISKKSVADYCLMKEKNSFLYVLVSLQNHLSAIQNITDIKKNMSTTKNSK